MAISATFKDGNVYTYKIPQNSVDYQIRVAMTPKGLWMCIEQSFMQWKLTISEQSANQTISKATNNQQSMTFKQFVHAMGCGLRKEGDQWSVGIMTPIQLDILRGGNGNKQSNNNKLYLILSQRQKKLHFPFTFPINDLCQKQKLIETIKSMKEQLDELRGNQDKSQNSFSILNETNSVNEQLKLENEEIKKKIKIYEDSLTLKRGAVEIDQILREKNDLEIKAETKRRQQVKEINHMKNISSMLGRDINQLQTQVDFINRELLLLEDNMGNPAKLKSHALRILKSYQTDLRASKKLQIKQVKDIQGIKRNIVNSKNNQRKNMTKIKQIQIQIDQAKKKANVKDISNRLHETGGSIKSESIASNSCDGRGPRSLGNQIPKSKNIVRENLVRKTTENRKQRSYSGEKNKLLKTTPNIVTPTPSRKTDYKPPVRAVASSHSNTIKANQTQNNSAGFKKKPDSSSLRSASPQIKKRDYSPANQQRQKKAMQRLTGPKSISNHHKPPINSTTASTKKLAPSTNHNTFGNKQNNNAKDILNRMKQVRAQYNDRSKNSAAKQKGISSKVSELTNNK